MTQLSVRETFRYAWETYTKKPLLYSGIAAITGLTPRILSEIQNVIFSSANIPESGITVVSSVVLTLINVALIVYFSAALIKVFLYVVEDKPVRYKDIFSLKKNELILYIIAGFIFSLYAAFGFLMLIIPGIILSLKYQFYPYFIFKNNLAPMDALEASSKITKGNMQKLFLIACITFSIEIVGVILTFLEQFKIVLTGGIGTILDLVILTFTVPFLGILHAYLFKQLSSSSIQEPEHRTV